MRLMPLARMKAAAAARLCSCSRSSWPSMSISWRMLSPPGGMSNSGRTMFSRSSDTSTEAVEFDVVLDAFDRRPGAGEARQRIAVEAVVDQLLHAGRVEDRDHRVDEQRIRVACAMVEDSAMWSSPIRASTPPCFDDPARLAWRKTSPERSTPGPLPYQTANTPSCLPSPSSSVCCEPQQAVAASSSLRPGWKTMFGFGELLLGLPQLLVEPAERRAAIAGDEAGRVQPVPGGRARAASAACG